MCGIMAYIGKKQAYPILMNGLKKLEYRGYDSSGVALMNGSLSLLKKEGKVSVLEDFAINKKTDGNIGLGHTRWATHGVPSDINAHPHQSQSGRYTIVHNGIIENHDHLRSMLIKKGYHFHSETDTEVMVQLVEWLQTKYRLSTSGALARALEMVEGSFAIVLFDLHYPDQLWAARRQSPLVLGIGPGELYISSDAMPLAEYIDTVIYLENDTFAEMNDCGSYQLYDLNLQQVIQPISKIKQDELICDMQGFSSFMEKEIHEQPKAISRLLNAGNQVGLDQDFDRIIITACGTSWHSGLIAKYLFEKYARINVEVEYASEFRYRNPVLSSKDLVIGISQSGETADTIAALELAKENGCQTLALVNVKNSTISRLVDQSVFLEAGPEIGVASTKAFTNQLVGLISILNTLMGKSNPEFSKQLNNELKRLPMAIDRVLKSIDVQKVSELLSHARNALFLGRGTMYPIALEGALKLKEISYIHAEGYPAGEMKHGPIALIDENMPVIAICNDDEHLPKILSNVEEVKARKGKIIVIKSKNVTLPKGLADCSIEIPDFHEVIAPIAYALPLQLIAHDTASLLNLDVDKPRNLAKSVTVE
ncbi:MAG: glutamine--fructose-6-phosphate transaminase (isomerizing) [Bacteroidota bacterium]